MPDATAIPRYRPQPSRREWLAPLAPRALVPPGSSRTLEARAPLVFPGIALVVLNRMGFGPRPGDVAAFNALGVDDDARLAAYVGQQLNPDPNEANDTEYHQRRNGLNGYPNPGFTTLAKSLTQLWQDHEIGNVQPGRPVEETRLNTYLRMVYSKWQLQEVLADFWLNHFNIYGFENYTQETFVHYDRDVIRANLFGNFRTLLEAVARSTSMLYYLDNYTNTRNGPNENWARELFELMTLGAENYYGVGSQAVVPEWGPGVVWPAGTPSAGEPIPAGYVDNDVYETARAFTGWGVSGALGTFLYSASNHDNFQKAVLSLGQVNIQPNQADEKDGEDVLDMLAAHPGTGRFLARKLCRRLISDDPPEALVEAIGDIFTANWELQQPAAGRLRRDPAVNRVQDDLGREDQAPGGVLRQRAARRQRQLELRLCEPGSAHRRVGHRELPLAPEQNRAQPFREDSPRRLRRPRGGLVGDQHAPAVLAPRQLADRPGHRRQQPLPTISGSTSSARRTKPFPPCPTRRHRNSWSTSGSVASSGARSKTRSATSWSTSWRRATARACR